ncbi:hypothetical protein VPH35_082353 [Triticum aestivum]|uniref:Secreted protein n=1 Tax=Triticum urartu TaxID=4572 RepID=A0A8R7UD63_TRIUA
MQHQLLWRTDGAVLIGLLHSCCTTTSSTVATGLTTTPLSSSSSSPKLASSFQKLIKVEKGMPEDTSIWMWILSPWKKQHCDQKQAEVS